MELLDGATLWPELRPLLPASVVDPIQDASTKRARERSLGGWLLALIAGPAVFAIVPAPRPSTAAMPVASQAAVADQAASGPAAPLAAPDAPTLEAQRRELAATVATLPGVSRTLWTSSSTLQVFVLDADGDPFAAICPIVEHYPALASSRIQVTPPAESGRPVRFRQCRSY